MTSRNSGLHGDNSLLEISFNSKKLYQQKVNRHLSKERFDFSLRSCLSRIVPFHTIDRLTTNCNGSIEKDENLEDKRRYGSNRVPCGDGRVRCRQGLGVEKPVAWRVRRTKHHESRQPVESSAGSRRLFFFVFFQFFQFFRRSEGCDAADDTLPGVRQKPNDEHGSDQGKLCGHHEGTHHPVEVHV